MRRAMSLAETVMAIFLLLVGGLACLQLLIQTSRYQKDVKELTRATLFADTVLNRMRAWAQDSTNFNSDWGIYANQSFSDGAFPNLIARVRVGPLKRTLLAPCGRLEAEFLPNQRDLGPCMMPVHVTVAAQSGGSRRAVDLVTAVAEPPRLAGAVKVTRGAGPADPVPGGQRVAFEVQLLDSASAPIEGMTFSWSVVPHFGLAGGAGNALVFEDLRTGRRAHLEHRYFSGDPGNPQPPLLVPGWVVVRATARYNGREFSGDSAPLLLAP